MILDFFLKRCWNLELCLYFFPVQAGNQEERILGRREEIVIELLFTCRHLEKPWTKKYLLTVDDSMSPFSPLMSKILKKIFLEDVNKSTLCRICHEAVPFLTKEKFFFFPFTHSLLIWALTFPTSRELAYSTGFSTMIYASHNERFIISYTFSQITP